VLFTGDGTRAMGRLICLHEKTSTVRMMGNHLGTLVLDFRGRGRLKDLCWEVRDGCGKACRAVPRSRFASIRKNMM